MEKKYWFYIDSYVHISVKKDAALFYNSYSGKILEYEGEPKIMRLVKKLCLPENLRVIPLWESELNNPIIKAFVFNIRKNFMGDLLEASASKTKPAQLPPFVKINKDIDFLKRDKNRSVGEDIMDYLTDIYIYINVKCHRNCIICNLAYRQLPYCTSNQLRKHELAIDYLKILESETRSAPYLDYHILGGNILKYSMFDQALELIKSFNNQKFFYLHYLNLESSKECLQKIKKAGVILMILVNWPLDEKQLKFSLKTLFASGIDYKLTFIIRDEQDFQNADKIINGYKLKNFEFKALYTGCNLAFFEKNIYIEKNEITEVHPSLKDIYSRSLINVFHFGKLTILPNRNVYADINASCLGILGQNSIYDIMMKELIKGKSWRKIRRNVLPCKSCTYECLCPPISNYNTIIGRNDLCHIRMEKRLNENHTGD